MYQDYCLTPDKYLLQNEQLELLRLLDKYRGTQPRNTLMLLLMIQTGARPQELLNLTWGELDLPGKNMHLRTLKGGRARSIPLTSDVMARLKEYGPREPNERVFRIGYNQFVKIWHIYRPVKKKLHSLRHTFAVNLYQKSNHNVRMVQLALGHRLLSTTMVYLELQTGVEDMRAFIGP